MVYIPSSIELNHKPARLLLHLPLLLHRLHVLVTVVVAVVRGPVLWAPPHSERDDAAAAADGYDGPANDEGPVHARVDGQDHLVGARVWAIDRVNGALAEFLVVVTENGLKSSMAEER